MSHIELAEAEKGADLGRQRGQVVAADLHQIKKSPNIQNRKHLDFRIITAQRDGGNESHVELSEEREAPDSGRQGSDLVFLELKQKRSIR